jgi:two-component system chemotaxis response regulator CheB
VIMFSSYTERGAAATLDALTLGATDYITKPSAHSSSGGMAKVEAELIQKVKAVASSVLDSEAELDPSISGSSAWLPGVPGVRRERNPWIIAIGASTGGPNALTTILGGLPASLPAPVLVIQHMPPLFTRLLAQRLDSICSLKVREAAASRHCTRVARRSM